MYLGFEASFPTLKCRKITDFIKMHFRGLIPRFFNHIILRISSICMRQDSKLTTSWHISVSELQSFASFFLLHSFKLPVFLCSEAQVRIVHLQDFMHSQSNLLSGLRCKWVFKNASRCAVQFRVSGCRQESRQRIPEELRTINGQLERWITQSCSLSLVIQRIHLVLLFLNFWTEADSLQRDSLSVAWRGHQSSVVELYPFPYSTFFVIPQCLSFFCAIFLKSCFSHLNLRVIFCFPL